MSLRQRHTLCWLALPALADIAEQLEPLPAALRQQARGFLLSGSLPGIVRRGGRNNGAIPLGFC